MVHDLVDQASYMAHGYCLLWKPWLVVLHAGSDFLIFLAYFAIPVAMDASDPRLKHPLRRGTVVVKRVSISAVRPGTEPPLAGLRAEVPVYSRIVEGGVPAGPVSATPKNVDFSLDVGMYNGRTRVMTPRYDPTNGQISAADLDGDPATLRDTSTGRIRQVPQVSVGMNVRF